MSGYAEIGVHGGGRLSIERLTKRYGALAAVDGIDLNVEPGEFMTILGPSGSGKTTTLALVAGFARPDEGRIAIDDRDLTDVPVHRRDIGMVFQNYALFPHMTAAENVGFPLRMRRLKRRAVEGAVERALKAVHLEGLGGRYPRELSGGQQQRIALARAFVFEPRLLLMDEPLGALDKKLREALQLEILRLSKQLGMTVMYVTHDQEEALVMSDRIAIFNDGRIEQIGPSPDLYERPASRFVAEFVGDSNVFEGRIEGARGTYSVVAGRTQIRISPEREEGRGLVEGGTASVIVRPEHLSVAPASSARVDDPECAATVSGTVAGLIYMGPSAKCFVRSDEGEEIVVRMEGEQLGSTELAVGAHVRVSWQTRHGVVVARAAGDSTPSEVETPTREAADVRAR
jgi:putative spermidine/putrescine transport system ATP-binding protein